MAAAKKNSKKKAKTKKPAAKKITKKEKGEAEEKASLIERRRSLRKRRRTVRMQQAGSRITNVEVVAGVASKTTLLTRTRIVRKREEIGILPIDKNVMIKSLVETGSIDNLAKKFGTTKQAIGGWFGRRGLAVHDVVDDNSDRKKEVL